MTKSIRYIASIDTSSTNPDGTISEEDIVFLDAVPSIVIDNLLKLRDNLSEQAFDEAPKNIDFLLLRLELTHKALANRLESGDLFCFSLFDSEPETDTGTVEAYSIDFNFESENSSNGQRFWIKLLSETPTRGEISILKYLAEVEDYPDTSEIDCREILKYAARNDSSHSIGVYDVGQANFCAIVNRYEHPLVFFDLGWPVRFNHNSNPVMKSFNPFALDADEPPAPVILSHLDWDHWAYAYLSGKAALDKKGYWKSVIQFRKEAIDRPWILRRPDYDRHKIGISQINFIQTLSKNKIHGGANALNIWPDVLDEIYFRSFTIFKCNPAANTSKTRAFLINNESLGLLLTDINSDAKVLLCGDADYPSIPAPYRRNLTGIVAPHHGGKITKYSTPNAVGFGRMVFSSYPGCYENVPSDITENEAKLRGWVVANTSERRQCLNNPACNTGNQLIRLSTSPKCGCGHIESGCLCLWQT
jgi:hypothetical protein